MVSLTELYNSMLEDQTKEASSKEELEKTAEEWVSAGRLIALGYIQELEKMAEDMEKHGVGALKALKAAGMGLKKVVMGGPKPRMEQLTQTARLAGKGAQKTWQKIPAGGRTMLAAGAGGYLGSKMAD